MASQGADTKAVRITLVGASIGEGWKFDRVPERTGVKGYEFRYVGVYDFDKSSLVERIVASRERPDVVMIKECATYFPGDMPEYRRKLESWVRQLRDAGIQPVLVTTAPLAQPSGAVARGKQLVKRMIGQPRPMDGITDFNDWLKRYAAREGLPVFDLEAVLNAGAADRWMKAEYDAGDRVHLNAAGYRAMDEAFARFLESTRLRAARP